MAMVAHLQARLKLYMDGPALALAGTLAEVHDCVDLVVLCWLVLGVGVAWRKGSLVLLSETPLLPGLGPSPPIRRESRAPAPGHLGPLESAVRSHAFQGTFRPNVVGAPRGVKRLLSLVNSDVVREGALWEAARAAWPGIFDFTQLTVNWNLSAVPHRDVVNRGDSWVMFFGEFVGGALVLEGGVRYREPGVWHRMMCTRVCPTWGLHNYVLNGCCEASLGARGLSQPLRVGIVPTP